MDIQPPEGSQIETRRDADGVTILIPPPRLSEGSFAMILFLLGWLVLWAVGWRAAALDLWAGKAAPFLLVWLALWTCGGVCAAFAIYRLARTPEDERLTLRASGLDYDSGTPRSTVRFWWVRNWLTPWETYWSEMFPRRRRAAFDRAALRSLRAQTGDDGSRLVIESGDTPVEIARYATDAERDWILRTVLTFYRYAESDASQA